MNRFALSLIAAALASGTGLTAHAAATMQMSTTSNIVDAGASFEVLVSGTGFADPMLGGGFMLAWNPAVLNLDSVTINSTVWEFARGGGVIDNTAGTLSDAYFARCASRHAVSATRPWRCPNRCCSPSSANRATSCRWTSVGWRSQSPCRSLEPMA